MVDLGRTPERFVSGDCEGETRMGGGGRCSRGRSSSGRVGSQQEAEAHFRIPVRESVQLGAEARRLSWSALSADRLSLRGCAVARRCGDWYSLVKSCHDIAGREALDSGRGTVVATDSHVPRSATAFGLRIDPIGSHLSSNLRLEDLRTLLALPSASATAADYRAAVVDQNLLGKPTMAARRITFARLRELYGLNPDLLAFRSLRDLWNADETAQPELALLCSTARDPILRAMTPFIVRLPIGTAVTAQELSEEAEHHFPGKFVPSSRRRLAGNASSSWGKAGLLSGSQMRERAKPTARPTSFAYALLLGHLCGRRGQALFTTLWASMLDAPTHELKELAVVASQQGWIEYRASGDVVEVSFRHFMRGQIVAAP